MATILLVRHGQTEWNRVERFRGRIDIELNATGLEQARKTASRIHKLWQPAAIFSSPLKRATQTAQMIAELQNLQVESDPALMDIDYGDWQGLTPDDARARWPEQIELWYEHPERAQIPGGESLIEVQTRAMARVASIRTDYPNRTVALVSHTVVNRLILLGILGLGSDHFWRLKQDPCAINLIESNDQGFTLCTMNDTCHLED